MNRDPQEYTKAALTWIFMALVTIFLLLCWSCRAKKSVTTEAMETTETAAARDTAATISEAKSIIDTSAWRSDSLAIHFAADSIKIGDAVYYAPVVSATSKNHKSEASTATETNLYQQATGSSAAAAKSVAVHNADTDSDTTALADPKYTFSFVIIFGFLALIWCFYWLRRMK